MGSLKAAINLFAVDIISSSTKLDFQSKGGKIQSRKVNKIGRF